ncbi:hypothetical protein [Dietzia sp. CH92]|uniref:hypothetical protein n=1 Tax=Dietzia sp. CH92 TaxID=3051823 RepID=UPI0028D1E2AB|nr:hypothetical protein [Dietzia sp. CH92]
MKDIRTRLALAGRRSTVVGAATALLIGAVTAPVAQAEPVTPGSISDGTLIWGVSGYAQNGIFGPWRFFGATGDAEILAGSVGTGTQTEYVPEAFPATSYPVALADEGKTPNAVKYTGGEGERDENGTVTIDWDGDFTFNGYPAHLNAPDEKLSDPSLTVNPDGSGALTFEVLVGAGQDQAGNPTPETNAGRKNVVTFGAGSAEVAQDGTITLNPEYAGVTYAAGGQTTCSSPDVWGSWPVEFVESLAASVRPHYYSTGCGGSQNTKAPLPVQLNYTVDEDQTQAPVGTPAIQVSETTLSAEGEHRVTVTGTGFNNPDVVGSYGPFAGKGTGAYVVFGRFLDEWRPSANAPSSSRVNSNQLWALPTETFTMQGGELPYIEIDEDGNFTGTLTVSKEAIDAKTSAGNYGIYTYAGGGFKEASYELFVPITFTDGDDDGDIEDPTEPGSGVAGSLGSLSTLFG